MINKDHSPVRFLRWAGKLGLTTTFLVGIAMISWQSPVKGLAQTYRTPTRTPRPTATRTNKPLPNTSITLTPRINIVNFSSETAKKINPGDVLDEIYVGGLGAGPWACSSGSNPWIEMSEGYSHMLLEVLEFGTCGWQVGELVKVIVEYPNGKKITQTIKAVNVPDENNAAVAYNFNSTEYDPVGVYHIIFSGKSGQLEERFRLSKPVGPYLFWYETNITAEEQDYLLRLYQFAPNEKIRMFVYYGDGRLPGWRLQGWEAYKVDEKGNLSINLSLKSHLPLVAIIGESSGEGDIYPYAPGDKNTPVNKEKLLSITRSSCPNAPVQRLQIGGYGEVCTKSDNVIVRVKPKRSSQELTRLMPGTIFNVTGPAVCSDNWSYWPIKLDDGRVGWVSEGGDNIDKYFICPSE
jgi:hypothetical protein